MTQKFDNFVRALNALCEEHEVQLTARKAIQVFHLLPGEAPVDGLITDRTQPESPLSEWELVVFDLERMTWRLPRSKAGS